jgi:hypothetical protein
VKTQNADKSRRGLGRRYAIYLAILLMALLVAGLLLIESFRDSANPAPPINPVQPLDGSPGYPFSLVPGNPVFDFPAAEGRLLDMDSDTWFLEGVLEGQESGRRFSFIVVYYVSRLGSFFPFNFYSIAFYDLDKAEYGTFTSFDFGSMKASTGFLDLALDVDGEDAIWTTAVDDDGYLIPYSYHVNLTGVDQNGRSMRLVSDVTATNPPVAVGADTYNGKINVLKQPDTFSYFQTGLMFDGMLSWGDFSEPVKGTLGHIDRQMFPAVSSVNARSWDARDMSHEWRTYFLENGMDFSSWRQFDRMDKNAEHSYGGATIYSPGEGARYIGDLVYENLSYVRTENHPVKPLMPARAEVLYFANRHRLSSASLGLDLVAEPIVTAPLLAFPVEYMHGPVLLTGTLDEQPIKGMGSFELTLHLYRDFELVTVLSDSVKHLPPEALLPASTPIEKILVTIGQVGKSVDSGDSSSSLATADGRLREELSTMAVPYRENMLQILDDLLVAIKEDS